MLVLQLLETPRIFLLNRHMNALLLYFLLPGCISGTGFWDWLMAGKLSTKRQQLLRLGIKKKNMVSFYHIGETAALLASCTSSDHWYSVTANAVCNLLQKGQIWAIYRHVKEHVS